MSSQNPKAAVAPASVFYFKKNSELFNSQKTLIYCKLSVLSVAGKNKKI